MSTIAQQKIIHRFIRPISDYEEGGDYYYRVVPLDTQAYAIYPHNQREADLFYVLGDGIHTYVEIRDGLGTTESAHEYPVISVDDIRDYMRKSHEPDTLYSTDSNGDTVNIPKSTFVFASTEPNIVYGTDESGEQILLPVDSFGKVDDVLVDGTSVVTDKIAQLGSMAGEDKNDYSTKAVADTLYANITYETTIDNHISDTDNPHSVTKTQVGLGNVDNTSDLDKPVSLATFSELDKKVDKVTSKDRVYGTDNNGNQTTYDFNALGKVDDVKVGTESVVTNKVANLGTMAGESKDDYVTVNNPITAATHTKITYDTKGLVTGGSDITASDVTDLTATAAEINQLHESNVTKNDLLKLHNITADANELNILDGATLSTTELNYVDGVTSSIQTQIDSKRTKINDANKVYITDASGNQSSVSYATENTASTIVKRDSNSQINVNLNPTDNSHATSKKYVDDKVSAAVTEAVVFKGIIANQTLLPSNNNRNGDLYWIKEFIEPTPAGITAGRSGAAIYLVTGQVGEFQYTEDVIYQPDGQTIELNTNGELSVMISSEESNELVINNDGLYVNTSDKVDKATVASILYGTDESGDQALIPIEDLASVKLLLANITVTSTNWTERPNSTNLEFKYQYIITNINITDDMIPEVTFDEKEASSGLLSPVCLAETGKLYIYSREVIDYNFVIPNVVFFTGRIQE